MTAAIETSTVITRPAKKLGHGVRKSRPYTRSVLAGRIMLSASISPGPVIQIPSIESVTIYTSAIEATSCPFCEATPPGSAPQQIHPTLAGAAACKANEKYM